MDPTVCTSYPKYNDTTLYTCITSPSRPRAAINWFEDGRNITNMSSSTYVSDVTASVLRYLPTVNRQSNISCVAIYEYREALISFTRSTTAFVQCKYPITGKSR
ncbi:hypothetical protein DPMN_121258 [Dreissena polymorpha]|uniref:Ig-like domain-containing protein n=1 Tax=Dreissena polymorpha TaxID=45954 RepID=A0A9D4GM33_DREPO|nr:hypothetical protein DPMN_121258 [Dreissena polymorpha]